MATTKTWFLVLVMIIFVGLAIASINNQNKPSKPSEPDPKVQELSSKAALLIHWQVISDTVSKVHPLSDALKESNFEQEKTIPQIDSLIDELLQRREAIGKIEVIEKYDPIKTKMIDYVKTIRFGLIDLRDGIINKDDSKIASATDSIARAKQIENEISNMIKVW